MSNTNRQAARASLALVEAVGFEPCKGDMTPFWEMRHPCDCYRCVDMAWQGATLPADGQCLAELDHDCIRWNRELRWELAEELEAEERYNRWRYEERMEEWQEADEAHDVRAERDATVAEWLQAA